MVTQRQLNKLGFLIEKSFLIDFELIRRVSLNISSLRKLHTIRGFCHAFGLPTRGQRTHTNASTANRLLKKKNSGLTETNSRPFTLSSRFVGKRKRLNVKNLGKNKK